MSYPTKHMHQEATPHAINVALTHAQLPQMLRQSNYLGAAPNAYGSAAEMRTANINFRVKPHVDSDAPPMFAQREVHELYPTQSTAKQALSMGEHDWSKHEIVASVAGLQTKLAELDSEIRSGASAEAPGVGVMRQMQDHANLLRENAKLVAETRSKHKETAALTHKICSQMHDNAQLQSTALDSCKQDIASIKTKQSSAVGLMHDICSELQNGLLEHGEDKQSMQGSLQQHEEHIARLQQKDAVAQELLSKMLTMLDEHESAVSTGRPFSDEHLSLLDGMCDAVENTKIKCQGLEKTQQEMHKVLADFKANRLSAGAYDTEAMEAKLDRYMRVNKDIDARCTEALQQHSAKVEELQRAHQQSLHEQHMKMQQLERAQQQLLHEQQSKLQMLERKVGAAQSEHLRIAELEGRLQELALQQLNNSQNASISRAAERDMRLLQHEMRELHGLRKDVDRIKEETSNVSTMQEDLRKMQLDSKARNEHSLMLHKEVEQVKSAVSGFAQKQQQGAADQGLADVHSKMLDLRRDITLQNIRIDKNATSVHDLQCKLAA